MIPLQSGLERKEEELAGFKRYLENAHGFALGGNWDYDRGSFDKALDEEHKVWLRIPFEVTRGRLDSDQVSAETNIVIGTPFVLKHLYNEGNDLDASSMLASGLVNQFQAPVDKDADIEPEWVEEAKAQLNKVEEGWRQSR
ncbi:YugN family protein [Paenibacillus thermoaerophilus]|jgi:hypothetical protein|uniref:YugN family protein n=1 Tax=Paenibacillus thermoaerophilus TaxID=1215385 RepID=A0ABW2V577_9BACL|nr:YugN family protein [Paenibacillus thermoaerophilus]TMV18475.1 hypothetical protein FE781_03420 [Paenibacillus thermoaerophilus]